MLGYGEQKEKHLRDFTASPSTQYQIELDTARRDSSDTTTSTAKTIIPPVASTETCMETTDWEQLNTCSKERV